MHITTTARRNAEAAYRLSPTDENLDALRTASNAEMDTYLAGFDARHADDTHTGAPPHSAPARLVAAYNRYIDEETANGADRHALLGFEAWKASRTVQLPPTSAFDTLNRKGTRQHLTMRTRFKGYGYSD